MDDSENLKLSTVPKNGSWSCPYCKKKDKAIYKLKEQRDERGQRILELQIELQKLKEKNKQYAYG